MSHRKAVVNRVEAFDFLKDLVEDFPDAVVEEASADAENTGDNEMSSGSAGGLPSGGSSQGGKKRRRGGASTSSSKVAHKDDIPEPKKRVYAFPFCNSNINTISDSKNRKREAALASSAALKRNARKNDDHYDFDDDDEKEEPRAKGKKVKKEQDDEDYVQELQSTEIIKEEYEDDNEDVRKPVASTLASRLRISDLCSPANDGDGSSESYADRP